MQNIVGVKKGSDVPYEVEDEDLLNALKENYLFEYVITPEDENLACILVKEDPNDSNKDQWKLVFYKKKRKLASKTITLDNMDELEGNEDFEYDFFKEIDCNFQELLKMLTDVKKKSIKQESEE